MSQIATNIISVCSAIAIDFALFVMFARKHPKRWLFVAGYILLAIAGETVRRALGG